MSLRIGIGYDIHRLVKGRRLFLGGVEIPFDKGLLGHSDADVLMHALCDGLLGACGLGDIGLHFPDTDAKFKDIAGTELLKRTLAVINKKAAFNIINIDTIVICDKPKLAAQIDDMKRKIASVLDVRADIINIKAKTTETTSPDTISSYVAVLVEVKD